MQRVETTKVTKKRTAVETKDKVVEISTIVVKRVRQNGTINQECIQRFIATPKLATAKRGCVVFGGPSVTSKGSWYMRFGSRKLW